MSPLSFGTPLLGGASATSRRDVDWGVGGGTPISSGHERGEALVRVERPGLDEVALVRLAPQRLHGADPHVPVAHLLLARRFDGLARRLAPSLLVADAERLVEPPVRLDVGTEMA